MDCPNRGLPLGHCGIEGLRKALSPRVREEARGLLVLVLGTDHPEVVAFCVGKHHSQVKHGGVYDEYPCAGADHSCMAPSHACSGSHQIPRLWRCENTRLSDEAFSKLWVEEGAQANTYTHKQSGGSAHMLVHTHALLFRRVRFLDPASMSWFVLPLSWQSEPTQACITWLSGGEHGKSIRSTKLRMMGASE